MSYLRFGKSNLPVGLKDPTKKILHFSFIDIAFKDLYANHTVIRRLGQTPVAAFQ